MERIDYRVKPNLGPTLGSDPDSLDIVHLHILKPYKHGAGIS